ncbi:MAG TPA: glucose 1-dehydrogenase [Verrucomicrobiae bacterium]|nr:glucose 1-dehydrogenase [Verrucomicrobiae bacterium]
MGRLQGKVAIVTGGSRGIGRGIVQRFLAEGASVIATARRPPDQGLPSHEKLVFLAADVAKAGNVESLFAAAKQRFGGLDILVNNAGIQLQKPLEETSEADWDEVMAVNVKGIFLCCRAAAPLLRQRGGGSIINIGSYDGFVADPGLAAYCASKGGVHALTRAIAVDHGKDGIRCNAVCPGWIETEMAAAYLDSMADPAATRARLASIHPLGRTGQPADIASLALWLASAESAFITGQQFVADGGLTARAPQP